MDLALQNSSHLLEGLTKEELAYIKRIAKGDTLAYKNLLNAEYEEIPVPPEVFFTDPHYLGNSGNSLYPQLLEDLIELFSGNYIECIMGGAIGYGKSTFTEFALLRLVYEMLCLRDPHESYGLMKSKPLYVVNISVTERQAKRAIFEGIKYKIIHSPFFKNEFPYDRSIESEMRFPKSIIIAPGASNSNAILGLDIIGAALDEGNFMAVQDKSNSVEGRLYRGSKVYDKAEFLYTALERRIRSRFLGSNGALPGMLFTLSSAQYPDDFIDRRMRAAVNDPNIFTRRYSLWEVKRDTYSKQTFTVEIGTGNTNSRIIDSTVSPEDITGEVIEVPIDFRGDFEKDPDGAIRDLAGICTLTVDQYIRNFKKVVDCVDKGRNHIYTAYETNLLDNVRLKKSEYLIINGNTKTLRYDPNAIRVAHIDGSLTGDSTGLAIGHIVDLIKCERRGPDGNTIVEKAPLIFYDLLLKINPPKGGEIPLERIRDIIYQLVDDGMPIKLITQDGSYSAEALQQFRKRGIKADRLSIDQKMDPYETLKQAFYENRINMYDYPPVLKELRTLEIDRKKRKVDHPSLGSKDVADAMAGVAYVCTTLSHRLFTSEAKTKVFY